MVTCILDYLSQPNPILDNTNALKGALTINKRWAIVTGVQEWTDFTWDTLMSCYGEVLRRPSPDLPATSPPVEGLELQIFDEDSFEHVLSRLMIPVINTALRGAREICYPGQYANDTISIERGGKAKKIETDDSRWYPDWAGIQATQTTDIGYRNLCPGETKLFTKWSTSKEGQNASDFLYPFAQIQSYCGTQWNTRYGYIITQAELCVVRISREVVGPGLAASRPTRNVSQSNTSIGLTPSHMRDFSIESVSSGIIAMSIDKASSFHDDLPDVEYQLIEYKSIPWNLQKGLTVKLALWWLHMLVSVPGGDLTVQAHYPPLDSWVVGERGGVTRKELPQDPFEVATFSQSEIYIDQGQG